MALVAGALAPAGNMSDFLSESFRHDFLDETSIEVVNITGDSDDEVAPLACSTPAPPTLAADLSAEFPVDASVLDFMAKVDLPALAPAASEVNLEMVVPPALTNKPAYIHFRDTLLLQSNYKMVRIGVDLNDNCSVSAQILSYENSKIWQVNLTVDELAMLTNSDVLREVKTLFYVPNVTEKVISGLRFQAVQGKFGKVVRLSRVSNKPDSEENVNLSQYAWEALEAYRDDIASDIVDMIEDQKFVALFYPQIVEHVASSLKSEKCTPAAFGKLNFGAKKSKIWKAINGCPDYVENLLSQKHLPKFSLRKVKNRVKIHFWQRIINDVFVMMLVQ